MDLSKLEKLKVVELRAELVARNLDIKGVKAVLIDRLKDAIEKGLPLVGKYYIVFTILFAKKKKFFLKVKPPFFFKPK